MKKIIALLLLFTTSVLFSQVPSYVPSNGLVGWWPFTGNANDLSGNGNNGVVNGATLVTDRFGNQNSTYSFNGTSNYIMLTPIMNLNSVSISAWVQVAPNNKGVIVAQNDPTNCTNVNFFLDFAYFANSSVLAIGHNPVCASQGATSSAVSSDNYYSNWYHLVGIISQNGSTKLYVNGLIKGENNVSGNFNSLCNSSNSSLRFGGLWWYGDNHYLSGKIDDIGIWNRALTQQEITNLYNASLSTEDFAINTIDIYPNPTTSLLNFKSTVQVEKILIYNMLGQLVQQEKVNALEGTINIEKLAQGTYLVKVNDIDKGYTIIKN